MRFPLYHIVRSDFEGDTIYPLHALKKTHPELYAKYLEKYADRMEILEQKIPLLDCLWNDAIHLLAIHPKHIHEFFAELGRPFSATYFVIDAESLDSDNLVVWVNDIEGRDTSKDASQFEYFNPDHYESIYSVFPKERQRKAAEDSIRDKRPVLLYSRCPHVLYKGAIDITSAERITIEKE